MRSNYWLILCVSIAILLLGGCSKDVEVIPDKEDPKPDVGNGWTAPSYADDYSSISSWSKRNEWNLANVHDPSVAYYK